MTTSSFPIVGQKIDHAQWRELMGRTAGFLNPSAAGLNLGLPVGGGNNATVSIGGPYQFRGFGLKVTATHSLSLPAATTAAKIYSVGIMYDPAKESDAAGPLALYAAESNAVVIPSGGDFTSLYRVTRQPGETIDLATYTDLRQWAYQPIFRYDTIMPNPANYPYGQPLTQNVAAGFGPDWFVRRGDAGTEIWDPLLSRPWSPLSLVGGTSGYRAHLGATPQVRAVADYYELRGLLERTSGATFNAGYTKVAALPSSIATLQVFAMGSSKSSGAANLNALTNGDLQVGTDGTTPWVSLDGIRIYRRA